MSKYEGKNAEVILGDDALILAGKGGRYPRRIPYGAIGDVQFKDAGALSEGMLWLVLGGNQPPKKLGTWAATGEADVVTFASGKQARQFKELHAYLLNVVTTNRGSGIDPASVGYDTLTAALTVSELAKLSLRPDVANAASCLSETPKVIRKSLKALSSALGADEPVVALTSGGYGSAALNTAAVLAVTERRVLVVDEAGLVESASMSREQLESAMWQQSRFGGRLDVTGAGRVITFRALDLSATAAVVDILSSRQSPHASASPSLVPPRSVPAQQDVLSQLERLAALRDAGVLTQDEFDQQKAHIVSG